MEERNLRKYVTKEITLLEVDEEGTFQAADSMRKVLVGWDSMSHLGKSDWSMAGFGH